MTDRVVHCKKDDFDQYVGRPTKWGNPYTIGKDGTREEVIAKFEEYLKNNPFLLKQLGELKGKVLACWCAPQACHAEVLVRYVDALPD